MKKKLNLGDFVSVIDESIGGKVVKIDSYRATIEDEFGFELEYPLNKLILPNKLDIHEISPIDKHLEVEKSIKPEQIELVDLHIESLKIRHDQLTMPKLEFQLNAFHEAIQDAKKNKLDALIIIHGKGSGTLKSAIYQELKKYSGITFSPIEKGTMKHAAVKINFNNSKN